MQCDTEQSTTNLSLNRYQSKEALKYSAVKESKRPEFNKQVAQHWTWTDQTYRVASFNLYKNGKH